MAYPEKDWICFGTLTTEQSTSGKTLIGIQRINGLRRQVQPVIRENDFIGSQESKAKMESVAEDRDPSKRTHLHFMLAKHK